MESGRKDGAGKRNRVAKSIAAMPTALPSSSPSIATGSGGEEFMKAVFSTEMGAALHTGKEGVMDAKSESRSTVRGGGGRSLDSKTTTLVQAPAQVLNPTQTPSLQSPRAQKKALSPHESETKSLASSQTKSSATRRGEKFTAVMEGTGVGSNATSNEPQQQQQQQQQQQRKRQLKQEQEQQPQHGPPTTEAANSSPSGTLGAWKIPFCLIPGVKEAGWRPSMRGSVSSRKDQRNSSIRHLQAKFGVLLKKLLSHPESWPFREPVDESCASYYEVIKNPIDLRTMEEKLNRFEYETKSSFTADFHLMMNNCRRFNLPETQYYKCANHLEEEFVTLTKNL